MHKPFLLAACIFFVGVEVNAQGITIDHTCIDLEKIPVSAIEKAKATLHIAYGHASHGSQLTKGMNGLFIWKGQPYAWKKGGGDGYLDLHDYNQNFPYSGGVVVDLGDPDRVAWVQATREYIASNPQINTVMWSWCGQASGARPEYIQQYLDSMSRLESDFPAIKFVYMTGHLDGTGLNGKLHTNNNIIRDFCIKNNKILYDFEDIESYNPDGVYFGDKFPSDACNYDFNGDGVTSETIIHEGHLPIEPDKNWAIEWQDQHVRFDWTSGANRENADYYGYYGRGENIPDSLRVSHSQPINYNMKAYAAWWLWARLAGWLDTGTVIVEKRPPSTPAALTAKSLGNNSVLISWTISVTTANVPEGFEVFRGDNSSSFSVIDTVRGASFTDKSLTPGKEYLYRVRAFNSSGSSEYSSNVAFVNTREEPGNPAVVTALAVGDTVRLFKGTAAPPDGWKETGFDDGGWIKAVPIIGYGDDYDYGTLLSDMVGSYSTIYVRKSFTINFEIIDSIVMEIDFDDGFIAYINGAEVAKANAPDNPTYQSSSTIDHESRSTPFRFSGTTFNGIVKKGVNVISMHALNTTISSSDFAIIPRVLIYGKLDIKTGNGNRNIQRKSSSERYIPDQGRGMLYDLRGRAWNIRAGNNPGNMPNGIYLSNDIRLQPHIFVR